MWCPSLRLFQIFILIQHLFWEMLPSGRDKGNVKGGHPSPLSLSLAIHAWPKLHTPFRKTRSPVSNQTCHSSTMNWCSGMGSLPSFSATQKTVFLANTIVFPGGVPHLIILSQGCLVALAFWFLRKQSGCSSSPAWLCAFRCFANKWL